MKHEGLEKLSRLGHVVYQGGDRISRAQSIIFFLKYTGEGKDEMDKCSGFQTQKVACGKSESEEAWNLMARRVQWKEGYLVLRKAYDDMSHSTD